MFIMADGEAKKNIVLHEKRKRRRHFNFITILRAVYFPDKDTRVCVRGCVMISFGFKLWVGRENGLFVVLHLNRATYRLYTVYEFTCGDAARKKKREMSPNNIQKIPDRR